MRYTGRTDWTGTFSNHRNLNSIDFFRNTYIFIFASQFAHFHVFLQSRPVNLITDKSEIFHFLQYNQNVSIQLQFTEDLLQFFIVCMLC